MGKRADSPIILIGFSGTGKSVVAREVAASLGWEAVDTDDEVVRLAGKGIPQIFEQEGEPHFRRLERDALAEACQRTRVVIATGGGAVLDPNNRLLMRRSGVVVCLEANPGTIYQRLPKQNDSPASVRPLLAMADPMERIVELKQSRQAYYAIADWTVQTDHLSLPEVCQEVIRGWHYWLRSHQEDAAEWDDEDRVCDVVTATERYPVYVGWGPLSSLGEKAQEAGLSGGAYVVADAAVFLLYGDAVMNSLGRAGFKAQSFAVPQGEENKTLQTVSHIYDWLVDCRAERNDVIVGLGGGVIGDMAGFVAATYLRGMSLVQVPTSLIAMTDASVGGKTGVNHPKAKNLIGAFHQPRLVLADVQVLTTLPQRELISGWAEVIKHGFVFDRGLKGLLEENAERLASLEPEVTTEAVRRSVAIKARIVSEDEREQGRRVLLNYGHTIGHGLEAATEYKEFLHGEAVSVGMVGAAMLSHELGILSADVVKQHRSTLKKFGLPTSCSDVKMKDVLKAMELDKKVRNKAVRWVLLEDVGRPVIRQDVPRHLVIKVLEELLSDL
ncbi:MAG: 3-dehydroquinate synthase [Dehalococcoidia bacterium]|nr:3-dehydroquinate synthase [Dehalococcoidia bacterium]